MSNFVIDLVKKYNQAWCSKDVVALCEVSHPDCCISGPYGDTKGIKALTDLMKACSFSYSCENVKFCCSKDGRTVVQCYDWVIICPDKATVPVCDWLTIEDGKIKSSCLYYDFALMPKERTKAA